MWAHLRRWLPQNGVKKRCISEFFWCFVYKRNRNCTFEDFLTSLRIFSPEKFNEFLFELQEQEEDVQGVPATTTTYYPPSLSSSLLFLPITVETIPPPLSFVLQNSKIHERREKEEEVVSSSNPPVRSLALQ
jgi:hypothetical protein